MEILYEDNDYDEFKASDYSRNPYYIWKYSMR